MKEGMAMDNNVRETQERLNKFFLEEVDNFLNKTRLDNCKDKAMKNASQVILWACSLDEFYKKNYSNYKEFKQKDELSGVIDGIRYGRNRAIHQFTQLLYITDGAAFPLSLPSPFFEVRWDSIENLPLPDKGYENKKLEKSYFEYLEKKPIRFTFGEIKDYFNRVNLKYN